MTAFILFLNLILVTQIFGETQNGNIQEAIDQVASQVKDSDTHLHLGETPYEESVLRRDVLPILPMALLKTAPPEKPSRCENTELLLKLLSTLLELLNDRTLEFSKHKYILALLKNYLDIAPESPDKNEMINKIKNLEAKEYKKPSTEALRNLFEPRTQIIFKTEIPKINQQPCKETLGNLIQNAYNTYLQLAVFPSCQQNGQHSNVNLDFMKYLSQYKPQDLSFDIHDLSQIDYSYHQQIPNKDINLLYSHLNSGVPSNDLMKYLQSQGLNQNLDIISILQNYRPGHTLLTGDGNSPNNGAPNKNIEPKHKVPLFLTNDFLKEPNNPVVDLTKNNNPVNRQLYDFLTQANPGNDKLFDFSDNSNGKEPMEVPSENLKMPGNNWKPPLNLILDSFNNQTVKHPTPEEIAKFLYGGKELSGNSYKLINDSNSSHNKFSNKPLPNTLVNVVSPNNVNSENYALFQVMPKENDAILETNINPNLNQLLLRLYEYLPKTNNGKLHVLPNINSLEELSKLFPKDFFTQNSPISNNPHKSIFDLGTLQKLIGLIPKDLLNHILPNLNILNNQTPSNDFQYLSKSNPNEQLFDANTLEKLMSLFPNTNVPNNHHGNFNLDINPETNNNQHIFPHFDNNKFVINPNLSNTLNNHNVNPNNLQVTDYFKGNVIQPDFIGSQLNAGPAGNKLPMLDWQRFLAETNFLKLNPKLNTAGVIELTYLLKRPKPFIYQPYYYVKYKLPYVTFMNNMHRFMRNNSHLRSTPVQLYQELISVSNVTDISPDLKGIGKDDVSALVLNNGALVSAKVLNGNDTFLNEQLKIIQNLTSEMQIEELLKLHNGIVKENNTVSSNTEKSAVITPISLESTNAVPMKPNFYESINFYRLPFNMFNRVPPPYYPPLPFYPLRPANSSLHYSLQSAQPVLGI